MNRQFSLDVFYIKVWKRLKFNLIEDIRQSEGNENWREKKYMKM